MFKVLKSVQKCKQAQQSTFEFKIPLGPGIMHPSIPSEHIWED